MADEELRAAAESLLAVVYHNDNGVCAICKGHWPNEHQPHCQGKRLSNTLDRQPPAPADDYAPYWRCFHCDATFTEHQRKYALEHFGGNEGETPVCMMRVPGENHLIAALRKAQQELASYRAEDTDLMRAIDTINAEHAEKLRRAEEKGYARGLADANAEFKNFHRSLCERFGYVHDEIDWRRDQCSLEEFIAKKMECSNGN